MLPRWVRPYIYPKGCSDFGGWIEYVWVILETCWQHLCDMFEICLGPYSEHSLVGIYFGHLYMFWTCVRDFHNVLDDVGGICMACLGHACDIAGIFLEHLKDVLRTYS